ncbi:phospholipid-transporting atpase 1 [Hordeum vulgare]|nr:phospholipid-transporting atpase 1 [Hordeum vulgare]
MRKCQRELPADILTSACNLFDRMLATVGDDTTNHFRENLSSKSHWRLVGLDGFPLDHEFPKDYGLEAEDDEMDIEREPLFVEELANQIAAGAKPKCKSKWKKAYTRPRARSFASVGGTLDKTRRSALNKSGQRYRLMFIEKFKAQYAALLARGGKEALKDHGDGEKARSWGKTNSKEDRWDAVSIAFLEKMEGVISKKDLREEKRRQEKEE